MQQSGAAEVRILIENSYKFEGFAKLKFNSYFFAKDRPSSVKSLNKFLKKLRYSG